MKKYKNILQDRREAACELRDIMPIDTLRDEKWGIVALSKGALELGLYIKENFDNSLDILFLETIAAPHNSECELACVSETEDIVFNKNLIDAFEIEYDYIYSEAHRKHEEDILSHIYQYRKGMPFSSMQNRSVLLVDEGSETGLRFMTALKTVLAQKPKAVYIAVPILPRDVLEVLESFVDQIFYLYSIDDYVETDIYYRDLEKLNDEMIEKILEENR